MEDENKIKKQLINELVELRQRIAELEKSETERKQADESLLESEERYRVLAEAAHDFIFIIDRNDKVQYVNSFAAKQLGYRPEEIIGKPRGLLQQFRQ